MRNQALRARGTDQRGRALHRPGPATGKDRLKMKRPGTGPAVFIRETNPLGVVRHRAKRIDLAITVPGVVAGATLADRWRSTFGAGADHRVRGKPEARCRLGE